MVEGREPFYIVEFQARQTRKGRGTRLRTKLKSYLTGHVLDRTFRFRRTVRGSQPSEECDMRFLYAADDAYTFMDTASLRAIDLREEPAGGRMRILSKRI